MHHDRERKLRVEAILALGLLLALPATAQPRISHFDFTQGLTITDTFTNGISTLEVAAALPGPWLPLRSRFTASTQSTMPLDQGLRAEIAFHRVRVVDLDPNRDGFENLVESYSMLSTLAGAGGDPTGEVNKWRPQFENGPATAAELSRPHIAMADSLGNIYIADKDAHAVRRISPEGSILTAAGTGMAGNGPDTATPGRQVALSAPNGLWVTRSGVVFILDLDNGKIRFLPQSF